MAETPAYQMYSANEYTIYPLQFVSVNVSATTFPEGMYFGSTSILTSVCPILAARGLLIIQSSLFLYIPEDQEQHPNTSILLMNITQGNLVVAEDEKIADFIVL